MPRLLAILMLCPALAHAQDTPSVPPQSAPITVAGDDELVPETTVGSDDAVVPEDTVDDEVPAVPPPKPPPEFIFRSSSDPLGQGDDRTAGRIEEALTALSDELGACRTHIVDQGGEPYRFLQFDVRMKGDGTIKKMKVVSSTGSPAVDACAQSIVATIALTPPPMFNDRLLVNLVWAKPPKKEDASPNDE